MPSARDHHHCDARRQFCQWATNSEESARRLTQGHRVVRRVVAQATSVIPGAVASIRAATAAKTHLPNTAIVATVDVRRGPF
jgi:hypothetical protein